MTKIVQQVGGDAKSQNAYTGEPRQLTVDTDNWDLRLHDGSTPGGHIIQSQDNADERYQAKSGELDGLSGFGATMRGLLVRLAPGIYRIRQLLSSIGDFTITNGDGYGGDIDLRLADTIPSEHTWGAEQLFESVCQFNAGLNGNVSGNTFGTHTGPTVGDVTGNLQGNVNGNVVGNLTGGIDTRGKTVNFDNGQIPIAAISGLLAYIQANAESSGTIKIWAGAIGAIPSGWFLCNGLNGTPDLRDRFVYGAGGGTNPGDHGGSLNHTHGGTTNPGGAHTHGITVGGHTLTIGEVPAHRHRQATGNASAPYGSLNSNPDAFITAGGSGSSSGASYWLGAENVEPSYGQSGASGGGAAHNHPGAADGVSDHTHGFTTGVNSDVPPYYALAYIMKG